MALNYTPAEWRNYSKWGSRVSLRTVALSARAVNELRAHRVQQAQELLKLGMPSTDDAFVVAQVDSRPLQPRSITHQWHLLLVNNRALPRIRFHDLRHAHATHMLASGVHPKIASERLGTPRSGTMDLYSHVNAGHAGRRCCSR